MRHPLIRDIPDIDECRYEFTAVVNETRMLRLRASDGAGKYYLDKPRIAINDSLVGVVVKRRKYIQVENVQQSSLYQHTEVARREGLISLLSVPLIFQGTAIGVLNVYTKQHHQFSNEEIQILTAFAELSAIAIQKSRLYQRLMNLEEQLRRSERLSLLGLIAAEVAHEIRNPLTVMKLLYHSLNLKFPQMTPVRAMFEIIGKR
jgi:signal transduction protein with GAF and PtsI domain